MATQSLPFGNTRANAGDQTGVRDLLETILRPIASLKLTVALLLMGIVLVFVGTLAQYELNMWDVIEKYFRSFYVYVPLQVFFPPSFFPSHPKIPGGFYFPGGYAIGYAMGLNLLAAHGAQVSEKSVGSYEVKVPGRHGVGSASVGRSVTRWSTGAGNWSRSCRVGHVACWTPPRSR